MKRIFTALITTILLSSCATTKQYVPTATLETLKPGNSLVRVERKSGFVGSGRSVEVTDNGVKTGSLSPGDTIIWQRPAGPMDINLAEAALAVTPGEPIHVNAIEGHEYNFVTFWSWAANTFVIRKQ